MAQFADYNKPDKDPNYLGLSKEIDVPRTTDSTANLIGDVTKIAVTGLNAVDTMNKDTIDKQLFAGVNQERQESIDTGLGIISGQNPPSVTNKEGEPDIPANMQQELRRAEQITQAKKMGKVEDVQYYGNMQEIAQRLTHRYPGYARYISDRMSHWLGTNAANAQRAAILDTARTMFATTDSGQNKWSTFVRGNYEHFYDADGKPNQQMITMAMNAFGNPEKMAQVESFIAKVRARKGAVTALTAELGLGSSQSTMTEDRALAIYRQAAAEETHGVMTTGAFTIGGMSFSGMKDIEEQVNMIKAAGGKVDPEMLVPLGLAVGRYEKLAEAKMRELANKPEFFKHIKSPEKLEAVRKELLGNFASLKADVGAGNANLVTASFNTFEGMSNNDAIRALGNPIIRGWNTFRLTAGPGAGAAIDQEIKLLGPKGIHALSKQIRTLHMMGISSGMISSPQQLVSDYNRVHEITGTPTTAQQADRANYLNSMQQFAINIVNNQNVPQAMRENIAKYIASGGNTEFINKLPVQQQMNAWVALAGDQTARAIKAGVSPAQWREYRTWNQLTFKSLIATQVSQINKGGELGANIGIVLDDNNQLRFDTGGREGRLGTQQQGGYPAGVSRDTIRALEDINLGLETYAGILKIDGKKLDEYELRALGLKLTKPETGGASGTGNRSGRTSGAPNGSEGPSTVTFATPFSEENPPNMGPSVAQFTRNPGEHFTRVQNPNERVQGGFRGMSEAEQDNPGLYVHDDQGIGARLRDETIPFDAKATQAITEPQFGSYNALPKEKRDWLDSQTAKIYADDAETSEDLSKLLETNPEGIEFDSRVPKFQDFINNPPPGVRLYRHLDQKNRTIFAIKEDLVSEDDTLPPNAQLTMADNFPMDMLNPRSGRASDMGGGASPKTSSSSSTKGGESLSESAIRLRDGTILRGPKEAGHVGILDKNPKADLSGAMDGFITSSGRFVGRSEALNLANRINQIRRDSRSNRIRALISEDLDEVPFSKPLGRRRRKAPVE